MAGNKNLSKIYLKNLFSQNVLILLIFFIDIITSVISSTQITCDYGCSNVAKLFKNYYIFKKKIWMVFTKNFSQ